MYYGGKGKGSLSYGSGGESQVSTAYQRLCLGCGRVDDSMQDSLFFRVVVKKIMRNLSFYNLV